MYTDFFLFGYYNHYPMLAPTEKNKFQVRSQTKQILFLIPFRLFKESASSDGDVGHFVRVGQTWKIKSYLLDFSIKASVLRINDNL